MLRNLLERVIFVKMGVGGSAGPKIEFPNADIYSPG